MPPIFDNLEAGFLPALKEILDLSDHADLCVEYFNLRVWKEIDGCIDHWSGGEANSRVFFSYKWLEKVQPLVALFETTLHVSGSPVR